jgi:hypothetical protein
MGESKEGRQEQVVIGFSVEAQCSAIRVLRLCPFDSRKR